LRRFVIDELDWQKPQPTVRLDDPPPGQEAQIDFALMGLVDDPDTGRRRKLWALLVTLSFSRQTTASVIEGLDAAWDSSEASSAACCLTIPRRSSSPRTTPRRRFNKCSPSTRNIPASSSTLPVCESLATRPASKTK
jgi:hypothetical protein